MVGKRPWTGRPKGPEPKDDAATRKRLIGLRFQDITSKALEDSRREEIKESLIEGMERDVLEGYRKSEDEIKGIKNKKLRKFYEDQNASLNDWLEVDTVVRSIADDIFESFNPDRDHDGINGTEAIINLF
jgi:hypothetical protein